MKLIPTCKCKTFSISQIEAARKAIVNKLKASSKWGNRANKTEVPMTFLCMGPFLFLPPKEGKMQEETELKSLFLMLILSKPSIILLPLDGVKKK